MLAGDQDVGAVLHSERCRLRGAENRRGIEPAPFEGTHDSVGRLAHAEPPAIREVDQHLGGARVEAARRSIPLLVLRRGREEAWRIGMVVAVVRSRLRGQFLEAPSLVAGRCCRQQTGHVGDAAVAPVIVNPAVRSLEIGVAHTQSRRVVSGQRDHAGACRTRLTQCLADRSRQGVRPASADENDAIPPEVGFPEPGVVDPLRAPILEIHAAQLRALR